LKRINKCKICKKNNLTCNHGKNIKECSECYIPITECEFKQLIDSNYYNNSLKN
jgi:hypothetical protein